MEMSREVCHFEDFELDLTAYRLSRNGETVRIERIPMDLLRLLVERSGELVTREEILERIWGKGVFVDSENAINTAVRKIRRALHDDAEAPRFIATIPAKGYRFVAPVQASNGELKPILLPNGELTANGNSEPAIEGRSAEPATTATISEESHPRGRRYWLGGVFSLASAAILAGVITVARHFSHAASAQSASKRSAELRAPELPDKPSIAVLPLANLSGDREQEYFSDGITNDLITDLSRLPGLFVIASQSTFTYKGKAARLEDVSRELGVKYVLAGSLRKAAGQLRITVQLADATTGTELWAERYDRPLRDVFALQDEVVRRIVTTLKLQLVLSQHGVVIPRSTENLEAYDYVLRGTEYMISLTKEANAKAHHSFEEAIKLHPNYAVAYALLAANSYSGWILGFNPNPDAEERALHAAQQATALDDSVAVAHSVLAMLYIHSGQNAHLYEHNVLNDRALSEVQRAIALDPNSASGYSTLADILNF
jgi:TolB-like protein/DNA-binding winged helix-turn-helix (wHTH) protein